MGDVFSEHEVAYDAHAKVKADGDGVTYRESVTEFIRMPHVAEDWKLKSSIAVAGNLEGKHYDLPMGPCKGRC